MKDEDAWGKWTSRNPLHVYVKQWKYLKKSFFAGRQSQREEHSQAGEALKKALSVKPYDPVMSRVADKYAASTGEWDRVDWIRAGVHEAREELIPVIKTLIREFELMLDSEAFPKTSYYGEMYTNHAEMVLASIPPEIKEMIK